MQDLSVILDFPIVLDTKLRLIGDREFRITCRVFALSPGVYLLFFSDFNPIHSEWALVICLDQRSEVKSRSDAVKLGQTLSEFFWHESFVIMAIYNWDKLRQIWCKSVIFQPISGIYKPERRIQGFVNGLMEAKINEQKMERLLKTDSYIITLYWNFLSFAL